MDYTGVSAGEKQAVDKICEANKQRREAEPEPEPAPVQPAPAPMPQPAAPDELTHLLCSCGLDKYAAVMAAQGITPEMLPGLDDTSLGLLGFNIGEKMTFRQVWVPPSLRFPYRAHIWINVYFVILGAPAALCP